MGLGGFALGGATSVIAAEQSKPGSAQNFITVDGQRFIREGKPYYFVGANLWYAAYAACPDPKIGNPGRLEKELDTLASLGVNNVRILASSELSPLKNSLNPAIQNPDGSLNEVLLQGLDHSLNLLAQRKMVAVLYLTNFWEWSGGMGTYEAWTNGGKFVEMNDPAHPWPAFPDYVSQFYLNKKALALYEAYVRSLVGRINTVTGKAYVDDPTIMAWQLCNEPRPGGTKAVIDQRMPAYIEWINRSARLIKTLDPHHLVCVGHEGPIGCTDNLAETFNVGYAQLAQASADIDYTTAHIWPQNWSWSNVKDLAGTFPNVETRTKAYIRDSVGIANRLGKPLVIEEFGFPRDAGSFDAGTPTTWRDRFYDLIGAALLESHARKGEIAGLNFWAWGGQARALHDDKRMRPGETAYLGDPPHEPQGWYSVFDNDTSTLAKIKTLSYQVSKL
ncbi:mannanase [Candidatus Phycosocius spiralis]|uniref:mannan endo-1,4-beta-mannosidase n=1 Tax=Candidatus Phycosocius spiralis TaxID=2815099 RepID=A0ABQ4PXQ8_9PROT|nr:mannanase [Candidatus Phycosocius spiralis]